MVCHLIQYQLCERTYYRREPSTHERSRAISFSFIISIWEANHNAAHMMLKLAKMKMVSTSLLGGLGHEVMSA